MSDPESTDETSAADTRLPVPVDQTRTYLTVQPTDESLGSDSVVTHFRRLHHLKPDDHEQSLLDRLFGDRPQPTIECLLVSPGDEKTLQYCFGIDTPEAVDALERLLRGIFPNTYELTRTDGPQTQLLETTDEVSVAAVEFVAQTERRLDWQTQLTPFGEFQEEETARVPLATIAETMAESATPMVYQSLLRPKADWSSAAAQRRHAIEADEDTLGGQFASALYGASEEYAVSDPDKQRLEEIEQRETRRSFEVNARAVAVGATETAADPTHSIEQLASVFADVSHSFYEIEAIVSDGAAARSVRETLCQRTFQPPSFDRPQTKLPWTRNRSRGIVADAQELGSFCLLDGANLTAAGERALVPTPGERTAIPRPPYEQLQRYQGPGLLLGDPVTQDGTTTGESVSLPPELQPLHVGWFGKTGSGKSTSLINGILQNHAATEGADVLIDPKGDGMAIEYFRAHYATYGTLDNVRYFDCSDVLPAFSFFDIRDELDAGVSRTTAVEDTVDHYLEILTQIMGREQFDQAVRSPDVIRYLTKAMFDPINGGAAFSHRQLHETVRRMHERQTAPPVSDDDLERMLAGVVANQERSFDAIMQGVANRMEKIPVDDRLARIFNHVPDPESADSHFDLANVLDENVVVVFDTGGLRSEAQRVLTLVILSNLWTALRRRSQRSSGSQPLVNVYIEEAASIAVSSLLKELLAQSRSFDCSMTLLMQFPAQLQGKSDTVYNEVLNNISTFVTGNVAVDRRLAERLATEDMNPQAVGNRLRALDRGQWLCTLPAPFGDTEPRPFLLESTAPPPGDPASDRPLSAEQQSAFEMAMTAVRDRTLAESGLTIERPTPAQQDDPDGDAEDPGDDETESPRLQVDSALPHTKRLPSSVSYVSSLHALQCTVCENRYDPDSAGMKRAIGCCSTLEETDSDDIPICDINLKLTPAERSESPYTDRQLLFLQAVYNAQQLRYDPLEYDLTDDSMLRLQEYVNIDSDAVQDLIDAGVLRHDTDHPYRLYTVPPDGREAIGESYRQGIDYGHGAGDLEESSQHVLAVELGRRYLEQEFVENPDSRVEEVIPYYDLDDQHRLDIAGVAADGEIVVAVEAERVNNDVLRAVPEDFDKMADVGVEEAIWIVMKQTDGHTILEVLNDPPEGKPRVEKTYAGTTPPRQFRIDTPGLTAMYGIRWVQSQLE